MIDTLLLTDLRTAAIRRLLPVLGQVMEKTDDALFDVWQQGMTGGGQPLFDALRELRRQRSVIEGSVVERIGAGFETFTQPTRTGGDFDAAELALDAEYSLLESDVLEEQLTCERLAAAVERRCGEALGRLARGLAQVAGQTELALADLPLAPLKIAHAWRDALSPVLEQIEWRLVALKHLERVLTSDLLAVIDELCRVMVSRGIVIAQPPRPRRVMMPPSAGAGRGPRDAPAASWDGGDNQVPQRSTEPPLDGEQMFSGGEHRQDGPDPVYEAMREMFAAYLGNVRNGQAPALNQSQAATKPVAEEDKTPRIDSASALVVLSRLQRQPTSALLAAVDNKDVEFVGLLRNELVNTAISLGRAPAGAQLEPHDEQGLTMVGMLFDTLLDQGHFSREVRERLVRLYVPYAKIALVDRRLFAHKLHPARRLLNLLAEACDGNAGDAPAERELLAKVFAISERLIDTFEEDVSVFTIAESEFSDFLSRHRRRITLAEQRAAEAQRGRERLEEARLEVTLELDSLVGKRQVPRPISEFFRRDWTHHLTMVALRDGVESDAFREARAPGVKLWMALLACEAGTPPPVDLREQLLPAMLSSGQGEEVARAALVDVIAALRASMPKPVAPPAPVEVVVPAAPAALQPPVPTSRSATIDAGAALARPSAPSDRPSSAPLPASAAGRTAPPVPLSVPVTEPIPPTEPAPKFELVSAAPEAPLLASTSAAVEGDIRIEADARLALPALVEQVKQLTVGTWVEFVQADGSLQPAKLSWISPISSRMLFVNRRGLRMCTLSIEELAGLMAESKMSLRQMDSAFDRAMSQVLNQLRSGAPATTD